MNTNHKHKLALWFSRHNPTPEQLEDALKNGFKIVEIETGLELGKRELSGETAASQMVEELLNLAEQKKAAAIFGVFPTRLLGWMALVALEAVVKGEFRPTDLPCYSSVNASRPVEGGKPTFVHQGWAYVGRLGK